VTFALTEDELSILDDFMSDNKIRNQSKAVRDLISRGIADYKKHQAQKLGNATQLSQDCIAIAEDYGALSAQGKKIVQQVVDAAVILFSDAPALQDAINDASKRDLRSLSQEAQRKLRGAG
jgi:hypothetical protein